MSTLKSGVSLEPSDTTRISAVKSGDLLAWKSNPSSRQSNFLIRSVAVLTKSPYGHVGIAWRYGKEPADVCVIEATIPAIKISTISLGNEVDVVPMCVQFGEEHRRWLMEKVDLKYGYADAVRAFFGKRIERNDRWQCAELCHYFYEDHGIKLYHDFTPGGVVSSALTYANVGLCRIA